MLAECTRMRAATCMRFPPVDTYGHMSHPCGHVWTQYKTYDTIVDHANLCRGGKIGGGWWVQKIRTCGGSCA
eukprot:6778739-Prymnesium_polylepis.1